MKKVLIVNTSYETMQLLEKWLERRDYDVKITGEIPEVVSIMKEFKPHLLLIDVMEDVAIPLVKGDDELQSTPILLMTGLAPTDKRREIDISDTIQKPFSLELLQKKIDALMPESV